MTTSVWDEDKIPNPAARADSPLHTPPGTNVNTSARFAVGDIWDQVYKLQAAVAALDAKVTALSTPPVDPPT